MSNFLILVKYEFKKIFKRKSSLISLVALVAIFGLIIFSNIKGRVGYLSEDLGVEDMDSIKTGLMDEEYIKNAISENKKMISHKSNFNDDKSGQPIKKEAYKEFYLPYVNLNNLIKLTYKTDKDNRATDGIHYFNYDENTAINSLDEKDAKDFYSRYFAKLKSEVASLGKMTDEEIEYNNEMVSKIKEPFYNDYVVGYDKFFDNFRNAGLVLLIVLIICISPIFAEEYKSGVAEIILPSKEGKKKEALAKLFTGISFTAILSAVSLTIFFLFMIGTHGFRGGDASLQIIMQFSTYPLTVFQAAIITIVVSVISMMLFAAFIMFVSSKVKNSFQVVIIGFVILFVPIILNIACNNRLVMQLSMLFPTNINNCEYIFSRYLFNIFGNILTPPVFYIWFSVIVGVVLSLFSFRGFKKHQVV